jgi:hypothetical protein
LATATPRTLVKSAKERLEIISAYQQTGSYRAAAALCGTTVRRVIERQRAGGVRPPRPPRPKNYRRGARARG